MEDLLNRYRDGYRVASWQIAIGDAIKVVGIIVGALLCVLGLGSAGPLGSGAAAFVGIIMGALVGGLVWCLGVFIVCQGQVLRATLDAAVNGSAFLSQTQRAEAMGLSLPASVVG